MVESSRWRRECRSALEALIYLKLKSPRRRDEADVIELLRINDAGAVRRYLEKNAPEILAKFDAVAEEAERY
jgi:hypothetical protein